MDLKRHVQDLRDNIRTNWTTTGQELSRELRAYWPSSRPQSPSRQLGNPFNGGGSSSSSISGFAAAAGIATSPTTGSQRPPSIRSTTMPPMNEFVYGYTLGLIGGVKSWMQKNRHNINQDSSRVPSDDDSDEGGRSPRSPMEPNLSVPEPKS
jgi:choline-phosphate cytidylyltransferase